MNLIYVLLFLAFCDVYEKNKQHAFFAFRTLITFENNRQLV